MKDEQRKKANTERVASNIRRQQIAKEERKKSKVRQEKKTVKQHSPTAIKKESTLKQEELNRKKWKEKRYECYQKIVWPGWRTSAPPGKIKKYNINDITENNVDEKNQ